MSLIETTVNKLFVVNERGEFPEGVEKSITLRFEDIGIMDGLSIFQGTAEVYLTDLKPMCTLSRKDKINISSSTLLVDFESKYRRGGHGGGTAGHVLQNQLIPISKNQEVTRLTVPLAITTQVFDASEYELKILFDLEGCGDIIYAEVKGTQGFNIVEEEEDCGCD